jgi:hypothetical protein
MPLQQKVDIERNVYKNTAFKGSGFPKLPKAYYQGGMIDFASIGNVINENRDLIQSGINTASQVVDFAKAMEKTVKSSKELPKIEEVKSINKKKRSDYTFTPEQDERFKSFAGSGFKKI